MSLLLQKKLCFVLLVGGRSSRMGKDKSYLTLEELNGVNFFENALSIFTNLRRKCLEFLPEIYLAVSCREEQYEAMQKRVRNFLESKKLRTAEHFNKSGVSEETLEQTMHISFILDKGFGVCEAVIECLTHTKSDCFFMPCDVPFMRVEVLEKLIHAWYISHNQETFPPPLSYVFEHNTRKESLIALYTYPALSFLIDCAQTRKPLQRALPEERCYQISYSQDEARYFQNMNTPDDLLS